MKKYFLILLILFFTEKILHAQDTSDKDYALIISHYKQKTSDKVGTKNIYFYINPFNSLLVIYKKVFSEQISANCEFEPSCSSFSMGVLKELGLIKGLFLTADRLTRCNGSAFSETQPYLINDTNAKIKDYPDFYKFSSK